MNTKVISNFAAQFGIAVALNPDLIMERNNRFYQINNSLKPLVKGDFFYAGVFLGKAKEGKFFPSFNLLSLLAKEGANRIVLDRKSAWLYICGRDILASSITRVQGAGKKNTNTLVMNEFGECLGFGRIVGTLSGSSAQGGIAVRNVSDIGDFLRRERY
jgi:ribosome biogenesis protein Nip4